MKNKLKIIGIILCLFALALVVNFGYYWKNFKHTLVKPAPVVEQEQAKEKTNPNLLLIPSLEITAPIIYLSESDERAFQAGLLNGVVHYPGTANMGQTGNAYIFGHSSDFVWSRGQYKTVFALLPRIEIGAEIQASDPQGNLYRYRVFETKVVEADDLSVLNQDTSGRKILSVQTSYPVGTALRRFVAVAELVDDE